MPFQVIFSQNAAPAGIIQFFSAGPDGVAVCDLEFTLTAEVIGDLQGNVFEWEQISGSPVTFTTPTNELSVTYNQTTFDDKTFRFYLNRGTGFEEFDDVTVFGSPTDSVTNVVSSDKTSILISEAEFFRDDNLLLHFITNYPIVQNSSAHINKSYTASEAVLTWEFLDTSQEVLGYIVRERDNSTGTWNDIASLLPTDNFFDSVTIGRSYQISAIVRFNNSHIGQRLSNVIWLSGSFLDIDKIEIAETKTYTTMINADVINVSDYNVDKLVVVTHNIPFDSRDTTPPTTDNLTINISDYDVDVFFITSKDGGTDTIIKTNITTDSSNITISDYDVLVLTGTAVGGGQ